MKLVALRDEDAFRYFYDKYRPKVYTCALRISKSREFAEDIVHEVFLKFWSLNDPERIANVEAFLRVVTRNHTLELLRKRILEYEITNELVKETNEIDNSTDNWINLNETNRSLREAVMLLPPQQRTVFQLCKEMAMEGRRFFDLVRWGIAEPYLNEYLKKEKQRRPWLEVAKFTSGRDEYLPIPQNQMNFSRGVYKQSIGY